MKTERYPGTSCVCILPEKEDYNKFYRVVFRESAVDNKGEHIDLILQVVDQPSNGYNRWPYIYRIIMSSNPSWRDHINLVKDYTISMEEIKI